MPEAVEAGVMRADPPAFMTQKQYAAHRGVGAPAVSNWKREGLLVFGRDPATQRLVDVAASDDLIASRRDPLRGRPQGGLPLDAPAAPATQVNDLQKVRTELLQVQTATKRLEFAKAAGDLAAVVELERRAAVIGPMTRDRVRSTLRALAERLAAEPDRRRIMAITDEAVDQAFSEIADQIEGGDLFGDTEAAEIARELDAGDGED
mgnify:CR=1 FL=1